MSTNGTTNGLGGGGISSNGDGNGNGKYGGSSFMLPLEIEEETISLFEETHGGRATVLRQRPSKAKNGLGDDDSDSLSAGFRGMLRSKTAFAIRNACLLATLAWMVFLFVDTMDRSVERLPMDDEIPRGPHQSSFGGKNNPASLAGQKAHRDHEEDELHDLILIPMTDDVGQKVPSIASENLINHIGHYWHDPYQSVYSAIFYKDITDEELHQAQDDFLKRLNDTKQHYGSWNLIDPFYEDTKDNKKKSNDGLYRPSPPFDKCLNRDCNTTTDFPDDAWQVDEEYVGNFIDQAKDLVHRVKEAIFEEYGHGAYDANGKKKSKKDLEQRLQLFQPIVAEMDKPNKQNVVVNGTTPSTFVAVDKDTRQLVPGVAHLSQTAWDALVKKLLHAMITTNDFYVVVTGGDDGTTAGHGNNFVQSTAMQFHYLMEPVLDFLGVKLISRNMAIKDASVVYTAMGGADLYGEMDILWYDTAENNSLDTDGAKDLLYKQAIMGGERVPVILTNSPLNLWQDSSKTAWIGNFQPNDAICGSNNKGVCDMKVHNSVCWVPRTDIQPPVPQDANIPPESFPGINVHHLKARKLTMLLLYAIESALDKWVKGIETDGFPLQDHHWHVSDTYKTVREAVRTSKSSQDDKNASPSACEAMMKELAMVCHMEMHGVTEWTPRVTPYLNSLRALADNAMKINNYYVEEVYSGIDLMPQQWAIPEGQVDPHLVAIATSVPMPHDIQDAETYYDDDASDWMNYQDDLIDPNTDGGDSDGSGDPSSRRALLREDNSNNDASDPMQEVGERRRQLLNDDNDTDSNLLPFGLGWTTYNLPPGFCDGSAQSTCGRSKQSTCLMSGHNDFKGGLLGDGLSGWLFMKVQNVKEGIILVHLDTTTIPAKANTATNGWNGINDEDGKKDKDNNRHSRQLNLPKDTVFEYSINGEVTSLPLTEFQAMGIEIAGGMTLYPLFVDADMEKRKQEKDVTGETVELGIRVSTASSKNGRDATLLLTHVYYA